MVHKVLTATDAFEFVDWEVAHTAAVAVWEVNGTDAARLVPDDTSFDTLTEYLAALNARARYMQQQSIETQLIDTMNENLEYWSKLGITTPEQLAHNIAVEAYHAAYKLTFGIRPAKDLSDYSKRQIEKLTAALQKTERVDC